MNIQLYVKNTSNCSGMSLPLFELLGTEWHGDAVEMPFVIAGGDDGIGDGPDDYQVTCEVTGWTDLFGGRPCPVHVAWVRRRPDAEQPVGWPDDRADVGVLVWGGDAGIRVTGPGIYEGGVGMPVMWLEDDSLLPDVVRAAIRPTAQTVQRAAG